MKLFFQRIGLIAILLLPFSARAADIQPVEFEKEALGNGMVVIYAPLRQAPVVHVRVLYHVGSRDERPDRQGFAHLFEHMMFRGSAHVAPEEHMKLVLQVGGVSNAFTSFDQTTYWQSLPSEHTEMALYLEADRMASFKVSDNIFQTERKVVAEEWRVNYANRPYGFLYQDFFRLAYDKHNYRWMPIGDMDQLRAANSNELQEFFNRYYAPNNACLIIAGDIDIAQTKAWVRKYYGWIPRGPDVKRDTVDEPEQGESRRHIVRRSAVPLPSITVGYKTPAGKHDDHYALNLLSQVLGGGRTSRLDKLLVNSPDPLCQSTSAGNWQLEDPSMMVISARALQGRNADEIEKLIVQAVAELVEKGVTQEELDKARTQARIGIIRGRERAQDLATRLGEEEVFGGDANRVNREWEKLAQLTPTDLQSIAKKYLQPARMTVLQYLPDAAGSQATAASEAAAKVNEIASAQVAPSAEPIKPRIASFPEGYAAKPPMAEPRPAARPYDKGVEIDVNGVKVIVMSDHRLPLVNWNLVMRAGGDAAPKGKEGIDDLTASMLRRGVKDMNYLALSQDLESRGISIDAADADDYTRLSGSSTTDQLEHGISRTRMVLLEPTFPADEFEKLKKQATSGLLQSLTDPGNVAERELQAALFGDSAIGRLTTIQSLQSITLDDVKKWYDAVYKPNNALLIFSGDVTPEQGRQLATKLLADWKPAVGSLPAADYGLPEPSARRRIILVDNPDGKQSAIHMGIRAYTLAMDDKFPGSLAGRILSDGIGSRLGKYLRAEKGYTYGARGHFEPGRHAGSFTGEVDTNLDTTAASIEAMFKVFNDMRGENVKPEELAEAKTRIAGQIAMDMQTIARQADRRLDGILNGYPIDYFDVYPQRLAALDAAAVRDVMSRYVKDDQMLIVVVAPAEKVKAQLESLGTVEVVPMPLKRNTAG